jgi:Protein of unknown function, DUF488
MPTFDLFTIGHSNIPAERFIALLRGAGVDAIADVRSIPASRFCPWFSAKNLAPLLAGANVVYVFFGEELGGRPRNPSLYCHGVADYEAMAQRPGFRADIDRLLAMARERCLCLMCSERDPLDCHRCLLVARALAARGVSIGHILHNGEIESHPATERRLLKAAGEDGDLFVTGQDERLAAAYRRRARAVAYRLSRANKTPGVNKTPEKTANKRATTINKKSRAKKKSR